MAIFSSADHHYMALALQLAKKGRYTTTPNPCVGCVIVKDQQIIGQGYHVKAGTPHAEVHAITAAQSAGHQLQGATAYVTLEPCSHTGKTPPCCQALINAKIARVVVAMTDPNPLVAGQGIAQLQQAGITVDVGLLANAAEKLNRGFLKRMRSSMPWVTVKLAASLDGKTAMASGESQWITSAAARQDVQKLRAQSCAIICGADSVITDNARMTVRADSLQPEPDDYPTPYFSAGEIRQPVRVVIDTQHRLTPDLALFTTDSPIIRVVTELENTHHWPHFVQHLVVAKNSATGKADLTALLAQLASQGMNNVLVEAGATLAGAFIEQQLVDELVLYLAPKLLGASAKSLVELPSLQRLVDAVQLNIEQVSAVGDDLRITAGIASSS
jgi:diaminohydroxyphosphoribosylaminopyrimidine deaminase/5-amino-6-(5-phosphoribosylamino)uracil reductase